MGRELKRVPLDFSWPMNKVWEGFINPHYGESSNCAVCNGTGESPAARVMESLWYGNIPFKPEDNGCTPYTHDTSHVRQFAERQCARSPEFYGSSEFSIQCEAKRISKLWNSSWMHHLSEQDVADLVAEDDLPMDFTRTVRKPEDEQIEKWPNGWLKENNGYVPSAEELSIYTCCSFGGGSGLLWTLIKARCARLGEPTGCNICNGEGRIWTSPEAKKTYEEWQEIEPPTGEGFQMWETVSEGSPISPVFATPEELSKYLSEAGESDANYNQWLAMIRGPGWAMSAVSSPERGFQTGVQAVGDSILAKEATV